MLVVIDMQQKFDVAASVVRPVVQAIRQADELGQPIMVIQYDGLGPSLRPVAEAANAAKRRCFMKKQQDSGAAEVLSASALLGWSRDKILLCGVNGAACVRKTFMGLLHAAEGVEKIAVLYKATACSARSEMWDTYYPDGGIWHETLEDFFDEDAGVQHITKSGART